MKKATTTFLFCLFSLWSFSQDSTLATPSSQNNTGKKSPSLDRFFTGGDLGVQFGTQTYILIAPLLGYRITDDFSAGLAGKYIYYNTGDRYSNYSYKTNIYGGGFFLRYNIFDDFFLHGEFESLSMEVPYTPYQTRRRLVSGLFLGGGYRQWLGNYSSLNLMLLYNVAEEKYSPYQNPIIRIGFDIGF